MYKRQVLNEKGFELGRRGFFSGEEKESTPLMEYEQTTEDIQPREECSTVSPPERSEMALYMDSLGLVNIADLDTNGGSGNAFTEST